MNIKNKYGKVILQIDVPRLSDADLGGANLSDADLSGANLSGANLRDANCPQICSAGFDWRGYHFLLVRYADNSLHVLAGCRNYSILDAIAHWTETLNQDALERVKFLVWQARARGWMVNDG